MTKISDLLKDVQALKPKAEKAPAPKIEKVKTEKGTNLEDGRIKNGGIRPNSGRKPGGTALQKRILKQFLAEHYGEEVEVEVLDKKTGKMVKVIKPRIVIQIERLFEASISKDGVINDAAIDRWLNRAIGKAPQPLVGDEDEDAIQVQHDVSRILSKVYGDDNEQE